MTSAVLLPLLPLCVLRNQCRLSPLFEPHTHVQVDACMWFTPRHSITVIFVAPLPLLHHLSPSAYFFVVPTLPLSSVPLRLLLYIAPFFSDLRVTRKR